MLARYSIADSASLVGEPSRAAMLLALLDGTARPASELAEIARLSRPAASLHLAKLLRGGLLTVRHEGRHRHYRLANPEVAHALEALGVIATGPPPSRSLSLERSALRAARTCYDHLAGVLAVTLAEVLERKCLIRSASDRDFAITRSGVRWFASVFGIDTAALARSNRALARQCLDWTERRPHIAGALGAAVLDQFLERRWIARLPDSRAVRITARGQAELSRFGL